MVKKIAVYGSYLAKTPVRQRYWKKRADGLFRDIGNRRRE
jgi:hypothetical protein